MGLVEAEYAADYDARHSFLCALTFNCLGPGAVHVPLTQDNLLMSMVEGQAVPYNAAPLWLGSGNAILAPGLGYIS